MATKTYTERLESVQAIIAKIEGGLQSYTIDNKTFTKADLATLYRREEYLQPLADREAAAQGGPRVWLGRPI